MATGWSAWVHCCFPASACQQHPEAPVERIVMKQFIRINKRIIDVRDVRRFENNFGCWGKLWLWSEKEPIVLGDGSYENDSRHVSHWVCDMKRLLSALSEYAADCDGHGWRERNQLAD